MKTHRPAATRTALIFTSLLLAIMLIVPTASMAELTPMSEGELKAIALNDFVRPVDIMIVGNDVDDTIEPEQIDTAVVSSVEAPIIIDGAKLIEDLMAQYESIQNGNGPIEGVYPFTNDPSYLLKQ